MMKRIGRVLGKIMEHWKFISLVLVLLVTFRYEGAPPSQLETQIQRRVVTAEFDFLGWEIRALWDKLTQGLLSPQRYMSEEDRRALLLEYLRLLDEIRHLNWEIEQAYIDPEVEDPDAATAELRTRLDELRQEEDARQPLAESILQDQTAVVLRDAGFGSLGQEFPPISSHFTPLPSLLVVSPRDRIENVYSVGLEHGLTTTEREEIEEDIDGELDVSSLVTGIGGLAAYPAMLLESSSVNWVFEVTAHEWSHHYLTLRPLGWNYMSSGETRAINETVASIVGKEIGREAIARYYPEYLPPEPEPEPEEPDESEEEPEPPAFDFREEMHKTRVRVDELLAEGKVEQAELYMELRRQEFVENGYYIRKLNQAYFAFHGAYADQPGASGEDPIGPAVRELRAKSPDLQTFVKMAAGVTTLEELQAVLEGLES